MFLLYGAGLTRAAARSGYNSARNKGANERQTAGTLLSARLSADRA